jgi:hypothetical protein
MWHLIEDVTEGFTAETGNTMNTPKTSERTCPMGHGSEDIFELQTPSGTWWPVCVRCFMEPPDGARWAPEAAERAGCGSEVPRPVPSGSDATAR